MTTMTAMEKAAVKGPERRVFPRGATVFKEGERGSEAYILQSGEIRIFKVVAGKRVDIGRVRQGAIFGELALLDDTQRMATAYVDQDATVLVLSKDTIQALLDAAPQGLTILVQSLVQTTRIMGDELAQSLSTLMDHNLR